MQLLTDKSAYVEHVMGFIDTDKLKPLKLVINSGNGSAGPVVDLLVDKLTQAGFEVIASDGPGVDKHLRQEYERWRKFVHDTKLKLED